MRSHDRDADVDIVANENSSETRTLAEDGDDALREMEIPDNAVAIVERTDRAVIITDDDRKDRVIDKITGETARRDI